MNSPRESEPTSRYLLWSATPTPFREDLAIDEPSVARLMAHHAALGVDGIMLGGSCGEGPWMPPEDLVTLVRRAAAANAKHMTIAAQVTDNSARRMLIHGDRIAAAGADRIVIAAPYFMMNPTPQRILGTYREVIEKSALPVVYYDRGASDRYRVANAQLPELLALENLAMVKDSSGDADRAAIGQAARKRRSDLIILTGDEFGVAEAVAGGMDGGFLGGAIFNAPLARRILAAVRCGDRDLARATQLTMNELMWTVYGGAEISAWLTGLKYLLRRWGLFATTASYLDYPLPDDVRAGNDALFEEPRRTEWIAPLATAAGRG